MIIYLECYFLSPYILRQSILPKPDALKIIPAPKLDQISPPPSFSSQSPSASDKEIPNDKNINNNNNDGDVRGEDKTLSDSIDHNTPDREFSPSNYREQNSHPFFGPTPNHLSAPEHDSLSFNQHMNLEPFQPPSINRDHQHHSQNQYQQHPHPRPHHNHLPPSSPHHDSHFQHQHRYDHNHFNNPNSNNQNIKHFDLPIHQQSKNSNSDSTSSSPETSKKRTRPVIRIKAERPPIRINSVGQIKLKPERLMRLKPKVKYLGKNKKGEEISEIKEVLYGSTQSNRKKLSAYSRGPTRSKVIPEKYLRSLTPVIEEEEDDSRDESRAKKSNKPSYHSNVRIVKNKSSKNHASHSSSLSLSKPLKSISSSSASDSEESVDFSSVFRPSSSKFVHTEKSKSFDTVKPIKTTIHAEGLEELEKNNYDKQLLKTLKNLMVTGGKRHRLDFEGKEDEIEKVQKKGRIPEKYLKQFPSEEKNKSTFPSSSTSSSDTYKDLDDSTEIGSTGDSSAQTPSSSSSSYEDDLVDDLTSYEQYDQPQSSNRLSKITRYRLKGFDPNYEYIRSVPSSSSSASTSTEIDSSAMINDDSSERSTITEGISKDGRKVKTYVLTGLYRKKVGDIVRNDSDQDGYGNQSDETKQIFNYVRPDDDDHERRLRELLEKCDDSPLSSSSFSTLSPLDENGKSQQSVIVSSTMRPTDSTPIKIDNEIKNKSD
ncbi:hypothetical protein QR98_0021840 [Sarcoptes scabiei]|uniref:Uncharacterized protein n=1 Tax=Sarcoptes scabiei TaxID=52283 RepID=A0A132A072_SARSC|nr:hypothetical protein QR98_0021840 [Sarcoptes scabiei]